MKVLVSDTSVLIDLERGSLLQAAFRLPCTFAVPDLLYRQELGNHGGASLLALGLTVEVLDGNEVALALDYRRRRRSLSLPDGFSLALAKARAWILLTGDGGLRQLAREEGVECHGVLWLLDRMFEKAILPGDELSAALQVIAAHPGRRLPGSKIRKRLRLYSATRSSDRVARPPQNPGPA